MQCARDAEGRWCNLSTSRLIGRSPSATAAHAAKVGEVNVVERMIATGAVSLARGNGRVIDPAALLPGQSRRHGADPQAWRSAATLSSAAAVHVRDSQDRLDCRRETARDPRTAALRAGR